MVLAMDVVRDGATDGHVLRAGNHWREPPTWNRDLKQLLQEKPRLAFEVTGGGIEPDDAIQPSSAHQCGTVIQT